MKSLPFSRSATSTKLGFEDRSRSKKQEETGFPCA